MAAKSEAGDTAAKKLAAADKQKAQSARFIEAARDLNVTDSSFQSAIKKLTVVKQNSS